MSQNINIKFVVTGNDLSKYISEIQSKSDKLTNSAIAGAIEQSKEAKNQLRSCLS